ACTNGSILSIAINATTSGGAKLRYAIPRDLALINAGAGLENSIFTLGTIPTMRDHTLPVHLRIPAGQNVSLGSDKNTVIVTVNF
ncbi:MAG TPA: hypothetical protein VGA09_20955, partial [Candidatus Binatia bacterium]